MTTRHARPFLLAVLALAGALALAACGGGGGGNGEVAEGGGGTKVPARIVVAQGVDPTTMDPHQHRETTTGNVLRHFYDPLLERDADEPTKFNPILATSWRSVDDTTVEFKLREGVKFSGGESFDGETVKYNVERVIGKLPRSEPPLLAYQFESVAGAEVVDPMTVRIKTKYPDPLILGRMATLLMVPKGAVDTNKDALASKPNGTGAYDLVRWDRNNEVVMKAKPNYFRGPAKVKDVVFRTMPEASSRLASLQTGDVGVITNVPPDNIEEIQSGENAEVVSVPSARVASVWLNTFDSKPLASKQVRQALNLAVDREAITKNVMSGYGTPVATITPDYFVGQNTELEPYAFDQDKAKKLLADAGYGNGFSLRLMVPRGRYLLGEEVTQAVVDNLKDVGVDATIQAVEFGVFAKATQTRKIPDAFYAAWGNAFFDPLDELQVAVLSGTKGFSWYKNPRVDRLINEAARTAAPKKHAAILRQTEKLIYDDPPFIFLFAYKDVYGISKDLAWQPRSDEQIYMYEVGEKS